MLEILGMGYYHPPGVITNTFLEELGIGSESEWIVSKIGIHERRTVLPLDYIKATKNKDPQQAIPLMEISTIGMGVKAAEMALARSGIKASAVGMVLLNTCTPTGFAPTEAALLTAELGIRVPAYDVMTACPAFALHIDFLNAYEPDALPDYILCVSTAALTPRVDYSNRSDSAIWGDGAAAWIVSPRHAGRLQVLDTSFDADPLRCDAVVVEAYGHFHQDGRAVRDFSVRQTVRMIKRLEAQYDIRWDRDSFIGHQANGTMLEQIRNNRKIPHENHWQNVAYIGNQAAAGAPIVLAQNWENIQDDQYVVVAVLGAGLSWGAVMLKAQSLSAV